MALSEQELVQLENRPKVLPFPGAKDFTPNFLYPKDTVIYTNGKLWRARDNFRSGNNFDATEWEQVAINTANGNLEVEGDITANGNLKVTGDIEANTINAATEITENGQRVYSPNNKPPLAEIAQEAIDEVNGRIDESNNLINQETQDRMDADAVINNTIDGVNGRIAVINNTIDGVKSLQLTGAFLTRVINGVSVIVKSLFDLDAVFIIDKTLINDDNGTVGVYAGDNDSAAINVRTLTNTAIGADEPALLGNVNTNADLPLSLADAESIGWQTPRVDDYAKVLVDETLGGKTVEWYIMEIDLGGTITWGNPVIINTGDYQQQTAAEDAGKVLTGGATPGTWGTPVPLATTIDPSSADYNPAAIPNVGMLGGIGVNSGVRSFTLTLGIRGVHEAGSVDRLCDPNYTNIVINQAIADIYSAGGGTLILREGIYGINETISLSNDSGAPLTIIGYGATILTYNNQALSPYVNFLTNGITRLIGVSFNVTNNSSYSYIEILNMINSNFGPGSNYDITIKDCTFKASRSVICVAISYDQQTVNNIWIDNNMFNLSTQLAYDQVIGVQVLNHNSTFNGYARITNNKFFVDNYIYNYSYSACVFLMADGANLMMYSPVIIMNNIEIGISSNTINNFMFISYNQGSPTYQSVAINRIGGIIRQNWGYGRQLPVSSNWNIFSSPSVMGMTYSAVMKLAEGEWLNI